MSMSEPLEAAQEQAPRDAESHSWWWLGTKLGTCMALTDFVCRQLGYDDPTWAVICAAFLVVVPPKASFSSALQRIGATLVGIVVGLAGAYAARWLGWFPSVHFLLAGLVIGPFAVRSSTFLYGVVVATVVSYAGGSGQSIPQTALDTFVLVAIGSLLAPVCVVVMEWARARVQRESCG